MNRRCAIPACAVPSAQRMMCFDHWSRVPLPLQKTLLFLFNQGRLRDGFEDALANAVAQVEHRQRQRFPGYLGTDP